MNSATRTALLACVSVLILPAACATAPRPRTFESAFHFDTTFDKVWSAVVETLAELNLPIANLEKDSGLVTTDWIGLGYSKELCDCGSAGLAIDSERTCKFNIFVKSDAANGVELRVNTAFRLQREFMDVKTMVNCQSTGVLEGRIRGLVGQKLAAPHGQEGR